MNPKLRVAATGAVAALATVALAATAYADGLPLPLDASQTGVSSLDGDSRYQTIEAGEGTLVTRTEANGVITRSRFLDGTWTIPAVAYDGTSSGLSADDGTLIVIEPRVRFPRRETKFTVLDPLRLRPTSVITLDGDFSFDAISPDGQTMYLIEYMSRRDPTEYQVRAYDLDRGRLDPEPIVDPEVAPVTMGGSPQTRAMSPDGRWAYTLYDSPRHHHPPFIHALDTETGSAACIDLEGGLVEPRRIYRMTLDPSTDGSTLSVVDPKTGPVAIVDTETFEVSEPPVEEASADSASDGSGGTPWLPIALGVLGSGGLLTFAVRRRRRSRAVDSDDLERLVRIEEEPKPKSEEREKEWDRVH
jgi:hypothetical protein